MVAQAIREALTRLDLVDGDQPVAVVLEWPGDLVADDGTGPGHEVEDAGREARLHQALGEADPTDRGARGRVPDDRIAAGERMPVKQRDIVLKGHAIECRINAEDPTKFTPSPGRITSWHMPGGPGVRVDSHAYNNYFVPPNYDSMIGKLIVHGDTREQALARMQTALAETVIEGIKTNIPLHQDLLRDAAFLRGGTSIHYLEERLAKLVNAG